MRAESIREMLASSAECLVGDPTVQEATGTGRVCHPEGVDSEVAPSSSSPDKYCANIQLTTILFCRLALLLQIPLHHEGS